MDPTNVPFELISYRGLLKSLDDIKNGNFFKKNTEKENANDVSESYNLRFKILDSIKSCLVLYAFYIIATIESFLFYLMSAYDDYVYSPLQKALSPIVKLVPRYIYLGSDKKLTIFSANVITLSRTFLVVPIAWFLKYDYNFLAFLCVVYHDFLDHLDGIVAKVQRNTYPNHDDPILGGFLDAFCDKIVNVLSIWTILQTTNFELLSSNESILFLVVCYGVMSYEIIIGIVRVDDFFMAKFKRDFKVEDSSKKESIDSAKVTAASMEGKLKEKLESTGIAFLCLAVSKNNSNPVSSVYGIIGIICLVLTLRMAHKSLSLKLKARAGTKNVSKTEKSTVKISPSADNLLHLINSDETDQTLHPNFENAEMKMVDYSGNQITEQNIKYQYKKRRHLYLEDQEVNCSSDVESSDKDLCTNGENKFVRTSRTASFRNADKRVDKVYTIGCFDLFHFGHVQLINHMRELGKKVIVGVHDSRSIYKLKKRVPVDSTERRMLNVKTVADEVFCIAGCDPSTFMTSIVNLDKNESALYVRGDDMPDFPSREVVENLMPIKFLPYTEGISTTKIRKEKFAHIAPDDEAYLEKIN